MPWRYGKWLKQNSCFGVVWSAVFSGAHWLEDHILISFLKNLTIVRGKEGLPAKILDSCFAKQILFVSAALGVTACAGLFKPSYFNHAPLILDKHYCKASLTFSFPEIRAGYTQIQFVG